MAQDYVHTCFLPGFKASVLNEIAERNGWDSKAESLGKGRFGFLGELKHVLEHASYAHEHCFLIVKPA